jgi:hypothetical protein
LFSKRKLGSKDSLTDIKQFTCVPALIITYLHLRELHCNYASIFLPAAHANSPIRCCLSPSNTHSLPLRSQRAYYHFYVHPPCILRNKLCLFLSPLDPVSDFSVNQAIVTLTMVKAAKQCELAFYPGLLYTTFTFALPCSPLTQVVLDFPTVSRWFVLPTSYFPHAELRLGLLFYLYLLCLSLVRLMPKASNLLLIGLSLVSICLPFLVSVGLYLPIDAHTLITQLTLSTAQLLGYACSVRHIQN